MFRFLSVNMCGYICSWCAASLKPFLAEHHRAPGAQAASCTLGNHCHVLHPAPVTYILNPAVLTAIRLWSRNFCGKNWKGVWVLVLPSVPLLWASLLSSCHLDDCSVQALCTTTVRLDCPFHCWGRWQKSSLGKSMHSEEVNGSLLSYSIAPLCDFQDYTFSRALKH